MSDDLVARLRHAWDERERQLDEDERVALASDPGPWEVGPTFGARDSRVYVREASEQGIDTIGTCVIAGQVANKTRFRENAQHIARHDPSRVLAEVQRGRRDIAAKRLMVEECLYEIGKSAPRSKLNDLAWSMLLQLAEAEGVA
jgi:hypothetical protein